MKAISRLKITQLGKDELSKRELNRLVGGDGCCICGCRGSSSNSDNGGKARRRFKWFIFSWWWN